MKPDKKRAACEPLAFGSENSPSELRQLYRQFAADYECDLRHGGAKSLLRVALRTHPGGGKGNHIFDYEKGQATAELREHPSHFLSQGGIALAEDATRRACGREVIFHGTRYGQQIIERDALRFGRSCYKRASFTDDPYVAAYWADLRRDFPDQEAGAIFILNRPLLQTKYSLRQCRGEFGDTEENIWFRDIEPISLFIVDVAWL